MFFKNFTFFLISCIISIKMVSANSHKLNSSERPTNTNKSSCNETLNQGSSLLQSEAAESSEAAEYFSKALGEALGIDAFEHLDFNWQITRDLFEIPGTPENQITEFVLSQVGRLIDNPEWTQRISEGGDLFAKTENLRAQIYLEAKLPSWKAKYAKANGSVVNPNATEEQRKQEWSLWLQNKENELLNLETIAKNKLAEQVQWHEKLRRIRADKIYATLDYLTQNPIALVLVLRGLPSEKLNNFRLDLAAPFLLMYLLIEDAGLLHPEPVMETVRFVRFDTFEAELEKLYFKRLSSIYPEKSREDMYRSLKEELQGLQNVQLNFGLYSSRRQASEEYFTKKFFKKLFEVSGSQNLGYGILNQKMSLPISDPFLNIDEERLGQGTFIPSKFGAEDI